MANYVLEAMRVYDKWLMGGDLGEDEVYRTSLLLGSPTRKLDVLVQRLRDVFSRLIEERCSETSRGRVCIYSWSRRAYKRYFPVALDAAGTILWYPEPGRVELASYPLHRALELGVHGVSLPEEDPDYVAPRLDGWQVNLYYDPVLGRWMFSTKYVLHNMMFRRGRLYSDEYGVYVNPLASTAHEIARRTSLYSRIDEYRGWTFTMLVVGPEPATAQKRLPEPEEAENYKLVLVAAREPSGVLHDPASVEALAEKLGLESLASLVAKGVSRNQALEEAAESIDYKSMFLWYLGRGDREHPEHYEAHSRLYEDYVMAVYARSAKPLVVLLTSGSKRVVDVLRDRLGGIVDEVESAIKELREALAAVTSPEALARILEEASVPRKNISSALRSLEEGRLDRTVRIIASSLTEGLGLSDAPLVIESIASRIRSQAS
ncbi:MAG: hypothetical protein ABWW69_03590 [Pyrodictiaceae archaeon]